MPTSVVPLLITNQMVRVTVPDLSVPLTAATFADFVREVLVPGAEPTSAASLLLPVFCAAVEQLLANAENIAPAPTPATVTL